MTGTGAAIRPIWLRILQFPLTRLIVLGAAIFWFMAWAQSWLIAYQDRPLLSAGIQIVLGLAAIALYVGYGRFVERRRVTELSLPGLGREWAAGALLGAARVLGGVVRDGALARAEAVGRDHVARRL